MTPAELRVFILAARAASRPNTCIRCDERATKFPHVLALNETICAVDLPSLPLCDACFVEFEKLPNLKIQVEL